MRGQPLLFLATVVLVWTAARIVHHLPYDGIPADAMDAVRLPPTQAAPRFVGITSAMARTAPLEVAAAAFPIVRTREDRPVLALVQHAAGRADFDITMAHQSLWMESLTLSGAAPARTGSPLADGPLPGLAQPPVQPAAIGGSGLALQPRARRWSVYGWSLVRQSDRPVTLAPAGQYGGSQAGLIVRYALGDGVRASSLYARVTSALARADDRTLALGVSARPWGAIPVELAVERRFALAENQRSRFAAMVVAGGSISPEGSSVRIDAFGQAGIVGSKERTGFFDLQMVATRPVAVRDRYTMSIGGGAWAGGQQEPDPMDGKRWLHRVDMGPRAALALPLGDSSMTVALDWRQRIDGNALPASGAALTLSAGF